MSLTILGTTDERLACVGVMDAVRAGQAHGGVCVLVPSFPEALQVQKALADEGIGMGVQVTTPLGWLRDLWDVWGDGRRILSAPMRTLLVTELVRRACAEEDVPFSPTPGVIGLLCSLVEQGLPWMCDAPEGECGLTPAERRMVALAKPYELKLIEHNLVEPVNCASLLVDALSKNRVCIPPVVLVGFEKLRNAELDFVVGLARLSATTMVVQESNGPASAVVRDLADRVVGLAEEQGIQVTFANAVGQKPVEREEELQALLDALFGNASAPVRQAGAVRLLEPAGPLAEAELVAREVARLAKDGARKTAIVVGDTRRAWRELAPKLAARHIGVRAQASVPVLDTKSGQAFMGYARTVAHLMELKKSWPACEEGSDGPYVRLGSMDWWPPLELVDFLLSNIAGVGQQKAYALEIAWRGNRLLGPGDVLAQLTSVKATSDAVAQATRELMKGRLGSAASKLLAGYMAQGEEKPLSGEDVLSSLAHEEGTAVLMAVIGAASTLAELGVMAQRGTDGDPDLLRVVEEAEIVLQSTSVVLRPKVDVPKAVGTALLVGRAQAAALAPASQDAVVLCGLTSQEFGVPSVDNELAGMLEELGMDRSRDPLAEQRRLFWKLCALSRTHLLLERTRFTADAHESYPAVMLGELTACYEEVLPTSVLAEDRARANLAVTGAAPPPYGSEEVAPAGAVDASLRRLVTVPQEGMAELPDGLPVLSASQLESYLECPLKWFSLRRLRLADNDAGFGPLEIGTFAHRVLELTYTQLAEEGKAEISPTDAASLAHAHEVLSSNFFAHLAHQRMKVGSKPAFQALVPHSAAEESSVDRLHRDLLSAIDYVSLRLHGYEPRAFEWGFGRSKPSGEQGSLTELEEATYAGVRVTGTVDRIDVNGQGQAVIIDYKHKGPTGFFAEYAAFAKGTHEDEEFVLPRRIQALMYAQVVRKAFPDLKVVGALYLGTRGTHELSGAVAESQADAIYGGKLGPRRAKQVVIPPDADFGQEETRGMDAFLDATEQAIVQAVERLRAGHIEANPVDAAACSYCPVMNCERRLS